MQNAECNINRRKKLYGQEQICARPDARPDSCMHLTCTQLDSCSGLDFYTRHCSTRLDPCTQSIYSQAKTKYQGEGLELVQSPHFKYGSSRQPRQVKREKNGSGLVSQCQLVIGLCFGL